MAGMVKMKQFVIKKQIKIVIVVTWLAVSVLVLFLFPAARKGPFGFGPPASMTTFQAADGSFSIAYPANWMPSDWPYGSRGDKEIIASIGVSGRQLGFVDIARRYFPKGNTKDVVDWGQLRAKQYVDYTPAPLLSLDNSKLKGFIQDYDWLHSDEMTIVHCQDVYILANGVGYSISFCSQNQDWAFLKNYYAEMLRSFLIQGENK